MANRIKNLYEDEDEENGDENDKQNRIQLLDKNNDRINQFIDSDSEDRSDGRNGKTIKVQPR